MTLSEWTEAHKSDLRKEPPEAPAIADLREVIDREIADAESVQSDDGRLEHAHAACLAAAGAALAVCGYRVRYGIPSHHWLLLESLQYTLRLSVEKVKELQQYRRKRSRAMYERVGVATKTEADAALAAAKQLRSRLSEWLALEYPDIAGS